MENLLKELKELKQELAGPRVVAKFHKVSFEQFKKDFSGDNAKEVYEDTLVLPVRSSIDSMGHDFVLTKDIYLKPGDSVSIQTGIRAEIKKGWGLMLAPRSGLGSKFRMQINNTIGLIDGDYFTADNEGHILVTITNDGKENKDIELKAGDRFCQGVFIQYGITSDDQVLGVRTGGHGSSGV